MFSHLSFLSFLSPRPSPPSLPNSSLLSLSLPLQIFDLPGKPKYISCVKVISGYVWIGTVGNGIHVYNANSIREPFGSW